MKHFSDESYINNDEYNSLWEDEYDHIYSHHKSKHFLDDNYNFDFDNSYEKDDDYYGNDFD